jgi:hypothetical protein
MTDKIFWIWLLPLAIGIGGCEKTQPVKRPTIVGKEQPTQAVGAQSQKSNFRLPGDKKSPVTLKTPDMPLYKCPADFKLPLILNIENPQVPKEIQTPSSPIEEENKQPLGFWDDFH